MAGVKQLNMIVLFIMGAITLLNLGLTINFVAASGQALAASLSRESVYLLAGTELAIVLLAYIVHKQKTTPTNS